MVSAWLFLGFMADSTAHDSNRFLRLKQTLGEKQITTPVTNRQSTEYQLIDLDHIHQYLPLESTVEFFPTEHLLVLTPLMNSIAHLDNYFKKLARIEYPADLISIGFLVSTTTEESNQDPTLLALQKHVRALRLHPTRRYRRITVIHQKAEPLNYTHKERHGYELQAARRKTLARCRNTLLSSALVDESWVLWLDSDVIDYPADLLLKLIGYNKDIIVPNCFRSESMWFRKKSVPYDRNNWIETQESLAHQRSMNKDEILFEGKLHLRKTPALSIHNSYGDDHPTYRQSMADLAGTVRGLIEIDGVGGTFTLVRASVHRAGINFPTLPIDHEIETEGMARWAKREGFGVFGVPHLIVQHA
ncbi:hypothetical protein FBU30_004489 [Linnemannia zychae]|nr:hypothetical protein FBU30_004489 [Linnemannia zychae]